LDPILNCSGDKEEGEECEPGFCSVLITGMAAPQLIQNFALSEFCVPQVGQYGIISFELKELTISNIVNCILF
jgi:hypothetical protein